MNKIQTTALLLLSMWVLSGCNTLHGFGQDMEEGGRAIERSADK
jgi:predicted small secreted protein